MSTEEVAYKTLVWHKLEYAAHIWSPYSNFRLIEQRKFRGQQPARRARDGETQVATAKCLISLSCYLLRPVWIGPPCFSFTIFVVEQRLLKKTRAWSLLTVRKLTGHHIYSLVPINWRIPLPRTIPQWNSPSHSVVNTQTTVKNSSRKTPLPAKKH